MRYKRRIYSVSSPGARGMWESDALDAGRMTLKPRRAWEMGGVARIATPTIPQAQARVGDGRIRMSWNLRHSSISGAGDLGGHATPATGATIQAWGTWVC